MSTITSAAQCASHEIFKSFSEWLSSSQSLCVSTENGGRICQVYYLPSGSPIHFAGVLFFFLLSLIYIYSLG